MKRLLVLGIVALVMVLVAAACDGDEETTTAPTTAPETTAPVATTPADTTAPATTAPPAEGGETRVAHFWEVNALTGQSASYGIRSVHGIELAAKHVND
ncbi:MAG: hypothetical protein J4F43_01685, partial [Dehalococcoidia bacterium]|nr:hypothetical protein [Dehalococcoidia bacterium]